MSHEVAYTHIEPYFEDSTTNHPVVVPVSISKPSYLALGRVGLIERTGTTKKGVTVTWNPWKMKFDGRDGREYDLKNEDFKRETRRDVAPQAVLRVLGDYDESSVAVGQDSMTKDQKQKALDDIEKLLNGRQKQKEQQKRQSVSPQKGVLPPPVQRFVPYRDPDKRDSKYIKRRNREGFDNLLPDDSSSEEEDVVRRGLDPDIRFIVDKRMLRRRIRQYIIRSLPAAAAAADAVIIHRGDGNVGKYLCRGVAMLQISGNHDAQNIRLMALREFNEYADGENEENAHLLAEDFAAYTHGILLRERQHKMIAQPASPTSPGSPDQKYQGLEHDCEDVQRYCKEMLLELGNGHVHTKDSEVFRPDRMPSRMACVLVGGSVTAVKSELLLFVKKRWPIFIVEGSGGYAHHLASIIQRIEEVCPNPTMDNYRSLLGSGDPVTAEILINGNIHRIRHTMSAEEAGRMIELALKPNETLTRAWGKFAKWQMNQRTYKSVTRSFQVCILILSLLTTFLSIFQTFLQLQFPSETDGSVGDQVTDVTRVYQWISLIVIALPILVSLLMAILTKLNPAGKWVQLRRSAELILREIYMYRTHTRKYSNEDIIRSQERAAENTGEDGADPAQQEKEKEENEKKEKERADEEGENESGEVDESILDAFDDREPYYSRDELLHRRLDVLTEEVVEAVSTVSLKEYVGRLPPQSVTAVGDDGFSDIGPDEYVAFRLKPKLAYYKTSAKEHERQVNFFTHSVYIFGALGTLIAAVALYEALVEYNLQAWVALTTALQTALTRYIDYTRIEWLMKKHNRTNLMLTNVEHWWAQLQQPGQNTDGQEQRNKLVSKVEALITDEVDESGRQLKNMMDKMRKATEQQQEDLNSINDKLLKGEDVDKVKALRAAGLDKFNATNIAAALNNPEGKQAQELRKTLLRIDEQVEEATGVDLDLATKMKEVEHAAQMIKTVKDLGEDVVKDGKLLNKNLGGMRLGDLVPPNAMSIINNKKHRQRIFEAMKELDLNNLNRQSLLNVVCGKSAGGGSSGSDTVMMTMFKNLPHRQLLTIFKQIVQEQMASEFQMALSTIDVALYDIIPSKKKIDLVIEEFRMMASLPWRDMGFRDVLALVKDDELRGSLENLGEFKLRGVLKRAQTFFVDFGPMSATLETVLKDMAHLDVDELFSAPVEKLELLKVRERLDQLEFSPALLSKKELLELLPVRLKTLPHVLRKSPMELTQYVEEIAGNSNGDSSWLDDILPSNPAEMNPFFIDTEKKERFLLAALDVPSTLIESGNKDSLIRVMSLHPCFQERMMEELRTLSEGELKDILGKLRTKTSKTASQTIFQSVAESLPAFDIQNILNTTAQRSELIDRCKQLKGVNLDTMDRDDLMSALGSATLVKSLHDLPVENLKELMKVSLELSESPLSVDILLNMANRHPSGTPDREEAERHIEYCRNWTTSECSAIITMAQSLSSESVEKWRHRMQEVKSGPLTKNKHVKLSQLLPDPQLAKLFKKFPSTDEAVRFIDGIRASCGAHDVAAYSCCEAIAKAVPSISSSLQKQFLQAAVHPRFRKIFIAAVTAVGTAEKYFNAPEKIQFVSKDDLIKEIASQDMLGPLLERYKIQEEAVEGEGDDTEMAEATKEQLKNEKVLKHYMDVFSDDDFPRLIMVAVDEVLTSAGLHAFKFVCSKISSFDLRPLVPHVATRLALSDAFAMVLTFEKLVCLYPESKFAQESTDVFPIGGSKGRLIKAVKRTKLFGHILDTLRNLAEDRVGMVIEQYRELFARPKGKSAPSAPPPAPRGRSMSLVSPRPEYAAGMDPSMNQTVEDLGETMNMSPSKLGEAGEDGTPSQGPLTPNSARMAVAHTTSSPDQAANAEDVQRERVEAVWSTVPEVHSHPKQYQFVIGWAVIRVLGRMQTPHPKEVERDKMDGKMRKSYDLQKLAVDACKKRNFECFLRTALQHNKEKVNQCLHNMDASVFSALAESDRRRQLASFVYDEATVSYATMLTIENLRSLFNRMKHVVQLVVDTESVATVDGVRRAKKRRKDKDVTDAEHTQFDSLGEGSGAFERESTTVLQGEDE